MQITPKILAAIRYETDRLESHTALSGKSGVSVSLIGKYLKGSVRTISDENWRRLRPCLTTLKEDGVMSTVELDGCALSDDERRIVRMLRSLPTREREKAKTELGERFISFTLAESKTG